ncbi:MAG TPA: hypothetical protein VMT16_07230 [Thermoanaerobaculia bacterium]|nr:hypothetical protein [Thermoanaerobaculia bacterium]
MRRLAAALARPGLDLLRGQARCLARPRDLAVLFLGLLLGWWIYVPLHELLHAAACLAAGGEVWRLEISPLYGGALLASAIPWVVAGGDYAGRLAGFSTGGSDLVYLATDLGPFLLTLFPGVWALRRAARSGRALLFGLAIPFALAPFLSLPGDAYEIGSLAVTQLPAWSGEAAESALRGDDVARVARGLTESEVPGRWTAFALAVVLALAWAWTTWGLGALVARQLGEGPVRL